MAKKTKKVIMLIVEGPTEETALSSVLKRSFNNEEIDCHIACGIHDKKTRAEIHCPAPAVLNK